jgi:hypothetical protein
METDLLIALAGGAVGAVLTAALAFGAHVVAVPDEVQQHDREVAERTEDLETWVADRDRALRRQLTEVTNDMNKPDRNLWSGAHGVALAATKERALHEYRTRSELRTAP